MPTKLAAAKINQTLEQLQRRIIERFPEAGLGRLCTDLVDTGAQTHTRVRDLTKPNIKLWGGVGILLLIGLGIVGYFFSHVHFVDIWSGDFADLAQALEALVNLLVIGGAAIWFLLTLDARQKRDYVLKQLHELRSFAHVIDMHQLTKDPMSQAKRDTASSPVRTMTPYELSRYLDYCTEMLSLTAKLAALYGEVVRDTEVIRAVNDLENLSSGIGRKIWQKIIMLDEDIDELESAGA